MTPAIDTSSSYANSTPTGSRLVSALAALVITALIVWMLIRLGLVGPTPPPPGTALVTIDLPPGQKPAQATKAPAKAKSEPHKAEKQQQVKAAAIPKPIVPPPVAATKSAPWNVIWMNHDQMAAADISQMQGHHDERAAREGAGQESADSGGGAAGAGGPPGPGKLFAADWYRRPTDAELATYMPKGSFAEGYGEVACRTVERYHVEDCKEIDSEPPGSGLGRAVLDAAWQFLVMPPRVNGRPMVGAWVRIRITYTARGELRAN